MDSKIFEAIVKPFIDLTRTEARIYQGHEVLKSLDTKPGEVDQVALAAKSMLTLKHNCDYMILQSTYIFGIVFDKDSDLSVIFGPFVIRDSLKDEDVRDLMIKFDLDLVYVDGFKEFISSLPKMSIPSFFNLLSGMNAAVNHEEVKLSLKETETYDLDSLNSAYAEEVKTIEQKEAPAHPENTFDYEMKVMECVKEGNFRSLFQILSDTNLRNPEYSTDPLRDYKDRAIYFITLVTHAAMEGGLDPSTAYSINSLYVQQVEACETQPAVSQAVFGGIKEACNKVYSICKYNTDNPTVNRAISFINEHLREKINSKSIAKELHLAPGYISMRFKKKTGIDLPTFINTQKINEAKRLLTFTDKSLSDISNYLSFSSQSYFQNIFKKITGITPKKYREKYQKNNDDK
ncbi:MAG: AraC family transcriptional regulator [Bacilli bacterium]|jgi:AraC-like DNA-binding protein|nr:AraC family transcriptional regulator [Bacilli bacterium]